MARAKTDVGVIEIDPIQEKEDYDTFAPLVAGRSRRSNPDQNHSLARPVQDVAPGLVRAISTLASIQHAGNYGKEVRRYLDDSVLEMAEAKIRVLRGRSDG